jgi:hypothetical protein
MDVVVERWLRGGGWLGRAEESWREENGGEGREVRGRDDK